MGRKYAKYSNFEDKKDSNDQNHTHQFNFLAEIKQYIYFIAGIHFMMAGEALPLHPGVNGATQFSHRYFYTLVRRLISGL